MKSRFNKIKGRPFYIFLLVAWCAGPLLLLLFYSLSNINPSYFSLKNYANLLHDEDFRIVMSNSLIVSTVSTFLSLSLATISAYAITRKDIRFGQTALFLFLAISMFPSIATLSPLYLIFRSLGLRDTLVSLIIPYTVFSLPIAIWMLSGYFKQIPKELELSAKLDGCSGFTIFWKILFPLLKSGIATTAILVFVTNWNEFIYAVAFTTTNLSRTLPIYISKFPTATDNIIGQLTATSVIGAIPLILIILFFQKKIVAGITAGAVKE